MANISVQDMKFLDLIFEMGEGYVLDFSNRTLAEFFLGEIGIDLDNALFHKDGSSKARRLRCFFQLSDRDTLLRALQALWKYRESRRLDQRIEEKVVNAEGRFLTLLSTITSGRTNADANSNPFAVIRSMDVDRTAQLKQKLLGLHKLEAHRRGYEFESFLQELFAASNLKPRAAFRIVGEQIDGSFELKGETYLVEAKWVKQPIGAAELRVLQGKLDEKAAWARGLFISYYGFTDVGVAAFGRGKRLVCVSGKDIDEALDRSIPIGDVIERKVRAAAETGAVFVPVGELFKN